MVDGTLVLTGLTLTNTPKGIHAYETYYYQSLKCRLGPAGTVGPILGSCYFDPSSYVFFSTLLY